VEGEAEEGRGRARGEWGGGGALSESTVKYITEIAAGDWSICKWDWVTGYGSPSSSEYVLANGEPAAYVKPEERVWVVWNCCYEWGYRV